MSPNKSRPTFVQEFNSLQQKSFIKNQFQLITKSGITQKVNKLTPLKTGQTILREFIISILLEIRKICLETLNWLKK